MSEFEKWRAQDGWYDKLESCDTDTDKAEFGWIAGWNAALEAAVRVCDGADKSTHPADLADAIRALKEQSNG